MLDAWQQATENIEKVMSEADFGTWIKPIYYSHHEGSSVYLTVPNSFTKEWLEDHYINVLTGALTATSGSAPFCERDRQSICPCCRNGRCK